MSTSCGPDPMLRDLRHLYVCIFTTVLVVVPNTVPNLQEKRLRFRVTQQGLRLPSVTLSELLTTLRIALQREACRGCARHRGTSEPSTCP